MTEQSLASGPKSGVTAQNPEFQEIAGKALSVREAVYTRHSIRRFEERAVPRPELEGLFQDAQRAPSWKNSQPWQIHLVTGQRRDAMADRLQKAARAGEPRPDTPWLEVFPAEAKRRMFDLGMKIYGVAGIDRKDKAARDQFMLDNFGFFGAPAAAFITSRFEPNFYVGIDLGCYLNTVMLLARERGLGTCPQAALSAFPDEVRDELGLSAEERVVCGISIGYPLADSDLNRYHTPRRELSEALSYYE